MNIEPQKKRRGRRKKSEMETTEKELIVPKKRGRKPKGGKLSNKEDNNANEILPPENVILHLKCNISEIDDQITSKNILDYNPKMPPEIKTYDILEENVYTSYQDNDKSKYFDAYNDGNANTHTCSQCIENNKIKTCGRDIETNNNVKINIKEFNSKLKEQKNLLYNGEMNGKTSACF